MRDNAPLSVKYVGPWDDRWNKNKKQLQKQMEEMIKRRTRENAASLEVGKMPEVVPSFVRRKAVGGR